MALTGLFVRWKGEPLRAVLKFPALIFLLILSGCGPVSSSPSKADAGIKRIVSLSPGITETLFALGFGAKVVGVGRFDHYPEAAEKLPRVGGYLDPNWEAIIRLQPDVLFVMESQDAIKNRAESLGLHCCLIDQHNLDAVLASFEEIAAACGNVEIGTKLRRKTQARLQEISAKAHSHPKPRVLVVVGRSPLHAVEKAWVAAPGSLCDDLLRRAGGVNVISDASHGPYPEISREGILSLDPDVILDLIAPGPALSLDPGALLRDWNSMLPLRARREKNIHILTQAWIVIPGPRVVQSLDAFVKTLHPDLP